MNKILTAGIAAPFVFTFALIMGMSSSAAVNSVAYTASCLPVLDPSATVDQAVKDLTPAALANAKTIYDVSVQMGLPPRAAVIALATALQESYLKNMANPSVPRSMLLPHEGEGADHDSVGLFQQRPSPPDGAGSWGTVEELMTPAVSAKKFYNALNRIEGWGQLPVTVAAQRVQVSAFPDAYAKHEPLATALATTISGGAVTCSPDSVPVSASGWIKPIAGSFTSGFRTPDRPGHNGSDIAGPKGTPIHAASNAIVAVAECTSPNCDIDGSMDTPGCGWMVELRHADNTTTRYCHMVRRPIVQVGQAVAVGQVIGFVGTSGNSSGPHLHFECHAGYPATSANAVDPMIFMAQRGVNLASGGTP